jgi:hypothetical protein
MQKLTLALVFVVSTTYVYGCDFCNYYLGLDPGYNKNTISLRGDFRKASMQKEGTTNKVMHGGNSTGTGSNETSLEGYFTTLELNAKYFATSKIMVVANLPYGMNSLTFEGSVENKATIGDLTLLGFYQIANTSPSDSFKIRHRLFGGLGIKLPTGVSSGTEDIEIPMAHELVNGTGSTDYITAISYIGKIKRFGWNLDVSYKFNSESKNEYRYGNSLNILPRAFYESQLKKIKILPHVGLPYELCSHDHYLGNEIEETGGHILWGSAGLDIYFGNFSITTDARIPIEKHYHGEELEEKYWLFTAFNFHF